MGDEQPGQQDQPDDSEPTPERKAELRAAYEANVEAGNAPYSSVYIQTRGEVQWIVSERGWRTRNVENRQQYIDFSRASFIDANLSGADLRGAYLSDAIIGAANLADIDLGGAALNDAIIGAANLTSADLRGANLSGAIIRAPNLSGADLGGANLSGAFIRAANLGGANLRGANLSGAYIRRASLSGVNLTQARMDAATLLGVPFEPDSVQLDSTVRLLDVAWNGTILANIQWEQVPLLGDEADIKAATTRTKRVHALRDAARAYQGLAKALQAQGLTRPALHYRTREQQLERRALLWSFALGPWLFSWLLNLVSGYGDKPSRALACYLAVVGAFTAAYYAITNSLLAFIPSHSTPLHWQEALVLSISSFHGRGFFPSMISLGDPVALVAAAEAIFGLLIELVFIATFTRRFFER
jgi:uncharacterized protein YjbI with pentapeptide repeats